MKKNIRTFMIFMVGILTIVCCLNNYFGWYAYEKWKYRRSTRGNIVESKQRGVFVKNLNYIFNKEIQFNCYIEKGYMCGRTSMLETQIADDTKYPYQVSISQLDTTNHIYYAINRKTKADSLDAYVIYLENMYLKDTVFVDVIKNNTDTIGTIKIYN